MTRLSAFRFARMLGCLLLMLLAGACVDRSAWPPEAADSVWDIYSLQGHPLGFMEIESRGYRVTSRTTEDYCNEWLCGPMSESEPGVVVYNGYGAFTINENTGLGTFADAEFIHPSCKLCSLRRRSSRSLPSR